MAAILHSRWHPPRRMNTLPMDELRLQDITTDACNDTFRSLTSYDHSRSRELNNQVMGQILTDVVAYTKRLGLSFKFVVTSTIIQHTTPVSETQTTADTSMAAKERSPVTTFRSRRSTLCPPTYYEHRKPPKVDMDKHRADRAKNRPPGPGDLSRHDGNSEKDKATVPIREGRRGEDPAAITAKDNGRGRKPTEGTTEAIGRFGDAPTKPTKRNVEATPTTKSTGKGREASATRASSLGETVARARANVAPMNKTTTDSKVSPFVQDIPEPPLIAAAKAASGKKKAEAAAEDGGAMRANATARTRSATKLGPTFRPESAGKIQEAAQKRAAAAKGRPTTNQRDGWGEEINEHGVLIRKAVNDAGKPQRRTLSLRGPTSYRNIPAPGTELIKQPGRQASLRAYWDDTRDGMWDVTWEGGLDHGFDVVICIIYIQLD